MATRAAGWWAGEGGAVESAGPHAQALRSHTTTCWWWVQWCVIRTIMRVPCLRGQPVPPQLIHGHRTRVTTDEGRKGNPSLCYRRGHGGPGRYRLAHSHKVIMGLSQDSHPGPGSKGGSQGPSRERVPLAAAPQSSVWPPGVPQAACVPLHPHSTMASLHTQGPEDTGATCGEELPLAGASVGGRSPRVG